MICLKSRRWWTLSKERNRLLDALQVVKSQITHEAASHGLTYAEALKIAREE